MDSRQVSLYNISLSCQIVKGAPWYWSFAPSSKLSQLWSSIQAAVPLFNVGSIWLSILLYLPDLNANEVKCPMLDMQTEGANLKDYDCLAISLLVHWPLNTFGQERQVAHILWTHTRPNQVHSLKRTQNYGISKENIGSTPTGFISHKDS